MGGESSIRFATLVGGTGPVYWEGRKRKFCWLAANSCVLSSSSLSSSSFLSYCKVSRSVEVVYVCCVVLCCAVVFWGDGMIFLFSF